jgi:hypothetical protein
VSTLSYQGPLKDALFARDVSDRALSAIGGDVERWKVYRQMVRNRLAQTIEHGFERLVAVLGAERFRAIIDRFLADEPPRSHYLRDVPSEFLRYLEKHRHELAEHDDLPPFAVDLARFECDELETAYDFEEAGATEVGPLEMGQIAVLAPAHRLIDVGFAVHRIGTDGIDGVSAAMHAAPFTLCLYRDRQSHEVTALELTPVTAAMLRLMEPKTMTLTDVVRNAAADVGVIVDVDFVEALSTLLADLIERGLLLGSLVPNPHVPKETP